MYICCRVMRWYIRKIHRRPKVNLGIGVDVGAENTGGIECPGMIGWLGMANGFTVGFCGWRSSAEVISRPKRRKATRNSYWKIAEMYNFERGWQKKRKFRKFNLSNRKFRERTSWECLSYCVCAEILWSWSSIKGVASGVSFTSWMNGSITTEAGGLIFPAR